VKSCHRFITAQNTSFNAGVPRIVCRSYNADPPIVILDHSDLSMALGGLDIGSDLLKELQLCRFTDAISVIKNAFEFKDQSMFNETVQLPDSIFRDRPGSEINSGWSGLFKQKENKSCVDQSPREA